MIPALGRKGENMGSKKYKKRDVILGRGRRRKRRKKRRECFKRREKRMRKNRERKGTR